MSFKQALLRFLTDLDAVAEKNPELSDISVQELLSESVIYYVIHRQENGLRPVQYGMLSESADEAVAAIVNRFAEAAWNDEQFKLLTAAERLELLQNHSLQTKKGSTYHDYLVVSDEDADAINSIAPYRFKHGPPEESIVPDAAPTKARYNIKVLYFSLAITLVIILGIIVMIMTLSPKS